MMGNESIIAWQTTAFGAAGEPSFEAAAEPVFGPLEPTRLAAAAEAGRPDFSRIDDAAIAAVTNLYRDILPSGGAILDVMSSWVSHLPPEVAYRRVVGIGGDARTLAENPFLDEWRVQDLNRDPVLPFGPAEFDAAAICASIQNLARPGEVIREIGRVLRPGAPLIVTFSERCLAGRAIGCWCLLDEVGQLCLVAQYFVQAGNWANVRCIDRTPPGGGSPLYAVIGRSLGADFPEND